MPEWQGIQLDETAFPVLLAAALEERGALGDIDVEDMVRRALGFIAGRGPSTDQDRWEENAGLNAFALATCIAALVAGGALLPKPAREWAFDLADYWNANIERWLVVEDTDLARETGVARYYVRTAPQGVLHDRRAFFDRVGLRNRLGNPSVTATRLVSTDFLQLVRFGLRAADDPAISDSVRVIDRLLRVATPAGPVWRRYNGDGYGEHEDGKPYDGAGCGRPWPLLTGERGHYELVAGRDPLPYLKTMAATASPGDLLPEQVWDGPSIASRRLHPGRPTGSAMPLAWAHAEFVKLSLSRHLGYPVDRPAAVWRRYAGHRPAAQRAFWWLHAPIADLAVGTELAIAVARPAVIHWGIDGWRNVGDCPTVDTGLGFFAASLPTASLQAGTRIDFTIRWSDDGQWIGRDFELTVIAAPMTDPDRPPSGAGT